MAEKAIERYVPHLDMRGDRRPFAAMQPHADGEWMRFDAELVRDAMRWREARPVLRKAKTTIAALEFGFNHRRCPVCAGFNVGPNGETDKVHRTDCTVAATLRAIDTAISHSGREQG